MLNSELLLWNNPFSCVYLSSRNSALCLRYMSTIWRNSQCFWKFLWHSHLWPYAFGLEVLLVSCRRDEMEIILFLIKYRNTSYHDAELEGERLFCTANARWQTVPLSIGNVSWRLTCRQRKQYKQVSKSFWIRRLPVGTGKTTRKYQFKVRTFGNKICAPKLITAVFEKHRGLRDCDVKFFATPPRPHPSTWWRTPWTRSLFRWEITQIFIGLCWKILIIIAQAVSITAKYDCIYALIQWRVVLLNFLSESLSV